MTEYAATDAADDPFHIPDFLDRRKGEDGQPSSKPAPSSSRPLTEGPRTASADNTVDAKPMVLSSGDHRRERLKPIMMAELRNFPKRKHLIKGLLGAGEMSVWFGEPGCGKSFLMMTTALHIARGAEWYGRKVRKALVIYIAAEGGGGIRKRLEAYFQHHDIEPDDITLAVVLKAPDLLNDSGDTNGIIYWLKKLKEGHNHVMVVVDTLSRTMAGGNENSPEDMGRFIMNIDRIRHETGAHVAIVHHTPKSERTTPRGHSSLLGAVDVAIKVETHQTGISATVEKNKDDEDGWSIGFKLEPVTVDQDEDGDDITSCVVVESDGTPSRSQKRLTGHRLRAMDALHDVLINGKPVHNHHGIPNNTVCAEMDVWRKEFYARTNGGQETRQKAFKRAVSDLQDLGLVGFRDGQVWAVKKEEQ